MNSQELFELIRRKRSFLCVGLDTDISLIPKHIASGNEPLFEFNRAIIDATHKYVVAYKPNLAFYEAEGHKGWIELEKTVNYIREVDPDILIIADAKRGDIGNTAERYASAFFEKMGVDAITVAPYMGSDSIMPFLSYKDKWAILLALTSNPSAFDFEMDIYEKVILKGMELGTPDNLMFVVGATRPERLAEIRRLAPNHFFLVPGVGAQGGTISEVAKAGLNDRCGLIVNLSRGILYASSGEDFATAAEMSAAKAAEEMSRFIR